MDNEITNKNKSIDDIIAFGDIVAHRGCWNWGVPENSLTAFRRSADAGIGIELDVHLLSDGSVAVFHDFTLWRMCFRPGHLEQMTRQQIAKCRLHFSKEHIPDFKEVLDVVGGRVPIYIELKCDNNEIQLADALLRYLDGYNGDYVFIGFHPKANAYLKEKGYLVGYSCTKPPEALPYNADCMICHIIGVPDDDKVRAKYPPFVPWTISNKLFMAKAKRVSKSAMYNTKEFRKLKKAFHK